MKNLLLLFFAALLLFSCDDGDLIVTEFAFENKQLQHCGTGELQVLYNVNNEQINEAIAFIFEMPEEDFIGLETPVEISLGQTNRIVYRSFDSTVDDYYCSEIPPASPQVVEEYQSTSGGTVTITPQLRNSDDHDQDGVPSARERGDETAENFPDTDEDTIPDYLDIDDDNDNVLTSEEINEEGQNDLDRYFDTDADGIPDYLDIDDDGDGVITRFEDVDQEGDPTNDRNDGLANYLNPDIVDSFEVAVSIINDISQSYRLEVAVDNLTLQNQGGNGEEITFANYVLGYFDTPSETITLPEVEDENEEEENTDGENENTDGETDNTDGEGDNTEGGDENNGGETTASTV